jgi:Zn-dependent protease
MLRDFSLERLLYTIPAIVIALVLHELAHALAALVYGDDTAKLQGRLSVNPLKHLDPLGFVFLLIAGFGWAKPVIFDVSKLRNQHVGPVVVALAGPFMNLLLAMVCLPLFHLWLALQPQAVAGGDAAAAALTIAWTFTQYLFMMNLGLFIFNLIPLPPLDGSYVLFGALPNLSLERKLQIYQIGTFALLAILVISAATNFDILPIGAMMKTLGGWLLGLAGLA